MSRPTSLVRRALLGVAASALIAPLAVTAGTTAAASGGVPQQFVRFTASTGATSTYHYYPSGFAGAGLVVYLDGDGQWGFDNPGSTYALGGTRGIVAQARARGLDVLAVRTPASDDTWWSRCLSNETYLTELLDAVRRDRGIDARDIWITGFSGGAQFTTQCYLPRRADDLAGGGTVVFGGGGAPTTAVTTGFTDATKANLSLNWVTGTDDVAANSPEGYDALGYAQAGYSYYTARGFRTDATWPAGVDHDSIGGQFGAYIGAAIDRGRAAAATTPTPTTPTTPPTTPTPEPTVPAPLSPTPTPGTRAWSTVVQPASDSVDVTVRVPSWASSRTTVRVTGRNGAYWYLTREGKGVLTFSLGDSWDPLRPGTTYTYRVINGGLTRASGTFTTED